MLDNNKKQEEETRRRRNVTYLLICCVDHLVSCQFVTLIEEDHMSVCLCVCVCVCLTFIHIKGCVPLRRRCNDVCCGINTKKDFEYFIHTLH